MDSLKSSKMILFGYCLQREQIFVFAKFILLLNFFQTLILIAIFIINFFENHLLYEIFQMQLKVFVLSLLLFTMIVVPILSVEDYNIGYFQFDLENPANTEELNEFQEVKWRAKQAYESQHAGTLGRIIKVYKEIINSGINYKIFFQIQKGQAQITTFSQWTGNVEVTSIKITEDQKRNTQQTQEQMDSILQQIQEIQNEPEEDSYQDNQQQKTIKQLDPKEDVPISINQETSVGNLQRQIQVETVDRKQQEQIEFKPVQIQQKNFLQEDSYNSQNSDKNNDDFSTTRGANEEDDLSAPSETNGDDELSATPGANEDDDLSATKEADEEQQNQSQKDNESMNRLMASSQRSFGYKSEVNSLKTW